MGAYSTPQIIDQYAMHDVRIIIVHQKNSGTAGAARNTALNMVTGDYIQVLDADDYLSDDVLMSHNVKLLQKDYDILIPDAVQVNNGGDIIWRRPALNNDYEIILNGEEAFNLSLDWQIHGFACYRASLLKKIKYDSLYINGDECTQRKLFFNADKISFTNGIYFYRLHNESTTKNIKNDVRLFEVLYTDLELYKFAVSNNARIETINNCIRKLTYSISSEFVRLHKNKKKYSFKDVEYIEKILHEVFLQTNLGMWTRSKLKYKIMYVISLGNYNLYKFYMSLYALFFCKM